MNFKKIVAPVIFAVMMLCATPSFAYTVQKGDTMKSIATNHGLSLQTLINYNPQVENPDVIQVGQTIKTVKDDVTQTAVTASEKDLLARLVHAEAQGEPYSGKIAVAVVVLNRVDSDGFPDTVKEVIYQEGQFTPVSNGAINNPAGTEAKKAVEEALAFDRSQGAGSLFFYNPKTATSRWLDSRPTTVVIGNHTFKK